jgi:hypothetical protein
MNVGYVINRVSGAITFAEDIPITKFIGDEGGKIGTNRPTVNCLTGAIGMVIEVVGLEVILEGSQFSESAVAQDIILGGLGCIPIIGNARI